MRTITVLKMRFSILLKKLHLWIVGVVNDGKEID